MLDKRKVSALGTYRSNFTKQILSFENHVEDVNALLEHLLYVCSTCKSIESAATSSRPEITFVLFPDVPDLLLAAMLAEGESSAAQIRQFEYVCRRVYVFHYCTYFLSKYQKINGRYYIKNEVYICRGVGAD